jgi:glutamate dehydrogenase (NAD(P)+)
MVQSNPFVMAQQQLDECARIMNLDPGIHQVLRVPAREIHVHLPV